ncbi:MULTISPECIES: acyl-CoA dehydrogenase family protein [unclassified Modestobacter]|uniref:acyl-CoA dehydrogenase family protein n=1 Tax=unclassified Modestobacter TaxID=2643866 RepID=UPI0022AAA52E|nr:MULTISPECIES: acyl-CoA dehydrogenase family protein [unclassified Modestobacter]MCZ2824614.1 acyl-CoA dehydrogenase family protein [Modestobacter sp. VKM Ac-2981]MCZ2853858.1 acyl-CoA dehydrogenase family protein [Modestobacter sp. VKM Ac-2982]
MTTTAPDTADRPDLVAAAREIAPLIREQAAANEAGGKLTDAVADALHDKRLFGMWTPVSLGGAELDPMASLEVIQTIAEADPSTAWVLMAASLATGTGGAYLSDDAVAEMFKGDRLPVVAGQGTRPGRAVRSGDGYRLSGEWGFASGIKHAQWIHTLGIVEDTGQPLIFVLPVDQATLADDSWNVMGLKATGSIDYTTDDVYVPAYFTHEGPTETPQRGGWIFKLGIMHFALIGHSAWALGVARRMLDDLATQVRAKAGRAGTVADSTRFQAQYGELEARYHAAQAFVQQVWQDATETLQNGGELSVDQRTKLRLALYNATWSAEAISVEVYRAAGTSALRTGPMQQYFRDMHAGTQHVTSAPGVIEGCGRQLAGLAPDHTWLYMNLVPQG